MRAVIQRVNFAEVYVNKKKISGINRGFLVLLAVHIDDQEDDIKKLAKKIIKLRIFSDQEQKMNLSIRDINGEILVVSQFTLYANTKKGNRPSFLNSAGPQKAISYYEKFVKYLLDAGLPTKTGEFGANMQVSLLNDGPVTLIMDTR